MNSYRLLHIDLPGPKFSKILENLLFKITWTSNCVLIIPFYNDTCSGSHFFLTCCICDVNE